MSAILGVLLVVTAAGTKYGSMSEDVWRTETQRELSVLRTLPTCCENLKEVPVRGKLSTRKAKVDITEANAKVRELPEDLSPVIAFDVPPSSQRRTVEFWSYSRKKSMFVRNLDRMFFIRPNVYFLDSEGQVIAQHTNVAMCWDAISPIGLWARFVVDDPRITRMVISSNLEVPNQSINFHTLWAPVGVKAISEAVGEYANMQTVWFARTGKIAARFVKNEKGAYGHCASDRAPDEKKWW